MVLLWLQLFVCFAPSYLRSFRGLSSDLHFPSSTFVYRRIAIYASSYPSISLFSCSNLSKTSRLHLGFQNSTPSQTKLLCPRSLPYQLPTHHLNHSQTLETTKQLKTFHNKTSHKKETMDHLPEPLQTILTNATYTYLHSTAHTHLTSHLTTLRTSLVDPYILTPLSHLLATTLSSSTMPDLMSALVLAATLLLSLIILDYIRRFVVWWVMWWVRFIVRLVFWGTVVGVGVYVWNVGGEQAVQDAGRVWGFLMGFLDEGLAIVEGSAGGKGKGKGGWL